MLRANAFETIPSAFPADDLAAALLADDRAYFAAGGKTEEVPSGVLTWLPSHVDMPVGCVAHVLAPVTAPGPWCEALERRVRSLGGRLGRIYAPRSDERLAHALATEGYTRAEELLMASAGRLDLPHTAAWRIEPVLSADTLALRGALYAEGGGYPDGKAYDSQRWNAMEQIKQAAGYMQGYIALTDGRAIGAVSISRFTDFVRLKNLLVHPDWRGAGVAQALVGFVQAASGQQPLLVMALAGSAGERLYRKCGMQDIGRIDEWTKPL